MKKILILSEESNDLSELLLRSCSTAKFVTYAQAEAMCWDSYDSIAVLAGNHDTPYTMRPPLRMKLDKAMAEKKSVFCEFLSSWGMTYTRKSMNQITHQRLVYRDWAGEVEGLTSGDVMDGRYNDCYNYMFFDPSVRPILTYHDYVSAHDHIEMSEETFRSGLPALWFADENTLICGFRLCNFRRARFAPAESWKSIVRYVVTFLAGEAVDCDFLPPVCSHKDISVLTEEELQNTIQRGLDWFKNADILIDGGTCGAKEGFRHQISAQTGEHMRADQIRTDCCAEIGGAYLLDWMTTGNKESKKLYETLENFCFTYMQIKDGPHRGMLRWTEGAWTTCYNDDTARVVLPTLLNQNFTKEGSRHFDDAVAGLQYLLDTTCPNGLRYPVSDCATMDEDKIREFREKIDTHETKAHHNSFHLAMFLLAYRQGAPEAFREAGIRGLTTIMTLFPYNAWETSETEELCRMILPLSILYQVTGEEQHKQWLYDMAHRLERLQHPSGGYQEWDSDYHADCSRRKNGECALLANNGDPVADLLYSNNWLPLGFAYAYLVTKDPYFKKKWEETARFMINCQIQCEDPKSHGAWARAFDLKRKEIYGVPHDLGWAPYCIESGWTVGEILIGLQFMKIVERELQK